MKANHVKRVSIYLNEEEYDAYLKGYKSSIYRSISTYGGKLLLGKPIKVIYRNRSLDDFIELAVKIRKELRALLSHETFTPAEKAALAQHMNCIEQNLIKIVEDHALENKAQ